MTPGEQCTQVIIYYILMTIKARVPNESTTSHGPRRRSRLPGFRWINTIVVPVTGAGQSTHETLAMQPSWPLERQYHRHTVAKVDSVKLAPTQRNTKSPDSPRISLRREERRGLTHSDTRSTNSFPPYRRRGVDDRSNEGRDANPTAKED